MKKAFLICAVLYSSLASAQLKPTSVCPEFVIDILDGRIGELDPRSTIGQIKAKYPCFTKLENESDSAWCGGGIFYKDRDLYFFTRRDYVEIGPAFKGKLTLPLMGAARGSFFKVLGNPMIKDTNWDAYQTAYGLLLLYFNKAGKVNKIRFSTEKAGSIQLCD
jgi:hypothetical protein